jgi:glucose/arabinose dehydrogenase/mono/diheme cytochrome c family protein
MRITAGAIALCSFLLLSPLMAQETESKPKIVFLTGDEEYRSEESMPMLARILRRDFDFDVSVGFSVDAHGIVDPNAAESLTRTEELVDADLMVLFLRFRRPDEATFQRILDFLAAGKPVVAFRTSTHAFRFEADSKWADWGSQPDPTFVHSFGDGALIRDLVGQKWITHHGHFSDGHDPLTAVTLDPTQHEHPILRGVEPFDAYSWLYHVEGGGDTVTGDPTFLLHGQALRSNHEANGNLDRFPLNNPVAWTGHHYWGEAPARVFTTTLGHPYDFRHGAMRRLALQGILWAMGAEDQIPDEGVPADPVRPYEPNNSGFGDTYKPGHHPEDFFPAHEVEEGRPHHEQAQIIAPVIDPVSLPLTPAKGSTIAIVGSALGERLQYHGTFEGAAQSAFPDAQLHVRNLANSGDTAGLRPHAGRATAWAFPGADRFHPEHLAHRGEGHYPYPDEWLHIVGADIVLGFFGYSESFAGPAGIAHFQAELRAWIHHTRTRAYAGGKAPQIVLVSPIGFEDRSATDALPNGVIENEHLAAYTKALLEVAHEQQVGAIDAFNPSLSWFADSEEYLTINGCHLNAAGYERFGAFLSEQLLGAAGEPSAKLRAAIDDKNWLWDHDYRMPNGVHAFGHRWQPFGDFNYPEEFAKIRQMTDLRDPVIWAAARGEKAAADDTTTLTLTPVATNFHRDIHYLPEPEVMDKFDVPEGFEIDLFASEAMFPDVANPVQLTFDNRGRLWVAVMPSYPHYRPGDKRPNDKILILEDTDGDGRADTQTTFADGLHLPIGFSIQPDGSVIVSQQPRLMRLIDTDGDDVADEREILLTGFDSHDTHHSIGAFTTGGTGDLYLLEGVFLHSQVETPYGTVRGVDAHVWRYEPRTWRLEKFNQSELWNPWGLAFDEWNQPFLADASDGQNYWATPRSSQLPLGEQHPKTRQFTTQTVRPTSGATFVYGRHFPAESHGDFLVANCIGFLGIKQHTVEDDGAGFTGELRQDLLSSTDPNFRPVDLEFAPDGSLYIVDWHNALVGHMQHSARDPNRDKHHGRIFRLNSTENPLVEPAEIAGASIDTLLANLTLPEAETRARSRRELWSHAAAEVAPALSTWASMTPAADPTAAARLREALFVSAGHGPPDARLLERALTHENPNLRAAAVRIMRHARHDLGADYVAASTLRAAADDHPRVRTEAIALSTWLEDENAGARAFLVALEKEVDPNMAHGVEAVFKQLGGAIAALEPTADSPAAQFLAGDFRFAEPDADYAPPVLNLSAEDMQLFTLGRDVYNRDASCAVCHQPNGEGLAGIYPPLTSPSEDHHNQWVLGNDDRLIKLVLKGVYGPMMVGDRLYDPANGVPPMTGFEQIYDDEEIAAVLTYIRSAFHWGFSGPVKPETVARVRAEVADKEGFYTVEELLAEEPFTAAEMFIEN